MNQIQKEILKARSLSSTKIVATLGPATKEISDIEALVKEGVSIFRINFSHGSHEDNGKIIENIRKIEQKFGVPISIFQDLQGPKIRIWKIKDGPVALKMGQQFILTTEQLIGDENMASITDIDIKDIEANREIFVNDGLIKLFIQKVEGNKIYTKVIDDGMISDGRGVNFPGTKLSVSAITEKDKKDLEFGLKIGVDAVALSFVREEKDIQQLRSLMGDKQLPIIAKIEKWEAIQNLEGIVNASDIIMVARGDLGVELPLEEIPVIQKKIISTARLYKKPVITATQMLISMVDNPTPTRPEITDISNAIFDGTDAVMLSNETATGKYPLKSVQVMQRIIQTTEKSKMFRDAIEEKQFKVERNISGAVGHSACDIAKNIQAKAIFCATELGRTARLISTHKPFATIFALTTQQATMRNLNFVWGVVPFAIKQTSTADKVYNLATEISTDLELGNKGESIIITSGSQPGITGGTNLIKIQEL